MTAPRRYRALSVDLWFTMLFYEAGDEERWRRARLRVLRDLVRTPAGRPYSESELSEALRATRRQGTALVRSPDAREPGEVVEAVAKRLGGRLTASREVGARRYSDAGLDETPPKLNPEVVRLAAGLRPLPMVVISNTGRRGSTWATVLELLGGPRFEAIVTSCEIGRGKPDRAIFDEASRRLGIPSREILHVGDRWDLDVEGALGAGFGAALYTGLWDRYLEASDADPSGPRDRRDASGRRPEVLFLDHLEELLEGDRFLSTRGSRP